MFHVPNVNSVCEYSDQRASTLGKPWSAMNLATPPKLIGILAKLSLTLASCTLIFLVFEASLRLYGYDSLGGWHDGRELLLRPSENPLIKYEMTPGASRRAWEVDIAINSYGFRGPEPTLEVNSGYRILALGDSITFGIKLGVEETFASQLQQLLDPNKKTMEVFNLGVNGYDTLQEVAALEEQGLRFHPDLVVVAYCLNDVETTGPMLEFFDKYKTREQNPLFRLRTVQYLADELDREEQKSWAQRQNDPAVFRQQYDQQIAPISEEESELLALIDSAQKRWPVRWYGELERIGRLRFAFNRLSELSKEHKFSVLVMIIPFLYDIDEPYPFGAEHRIVEYEARRAEFDTIDLTPQFEAYGIRNLKISPSDGIHPNKAGHAIMAQELAEYVQTKRKKPSSEI
jgi:lysophospholipase L1-like esterase